MSKPLDWLADSPATHPPAGRDVYFAMAESIGYSLVAGLVIAGLYYVTLGRRKSDSAAAMPLTLVLLSLLVCMVTLIVNGSVALAFTLGGTLAIVRFRTVVDDTRDTAFVIAAVVVGMGLGTGQSEAVYVGLPVFVLVVLVAFFLLSNEAAAPGHRIIVRLANDKDPEELTRAAFAMLSSKPTLLGLEIAKQGTAIEAIYGARKLDSTMILKLLNSLRGVDGVLGVEVKPL